MEYDIDNYNCAHFVADWYKNKLDIDIPVINEFGLSFAMWLRRHFTRIDRPEPHSLVIMTNRDGTLHVGVFYGGMIRHNFKPANGRGSPCAWTLTSARNEYKKVEFAKWSK